jgi:hypothetical protein
MADPVHSKNPYPGFLETLVSRFKEHLGRIEVEHNFEYGAEFEIAVCNVLREVMPSRVGICRGYVVGYDGTLAGDDIILFDAARFPTLRLLQGDLSRKEQVPADAVLAYIEAKHTLYLKGDSGQSLQKALKQVRAVKALRRRTIGMNQVGNVSFGPMFDLNTDRGFPTVRNPYACAIWAPHIDLGGVNVHPDCLVRQLFEVMGTVTDASGPDVVAAGRYLASPAVQIDGESLSPRPLIGQGCELVGSEHVAGALGLALFHLLWAVEWIELGSMPWSRMLGHELGQVGVYAGRPTVAK